MISTNDTAIARAGAFYVHRIIQGAAGGPAHSASDRVPDHPQFESGQVARD